MVILEGRQVLTYSFWVSLVFRKPFLVRFCFLVGRQEKQETGIQNRNGNGNRNRKRNRNRNVKENGYQNRDIIYHNLLLWSDRRERAAKYQDLREIYKVGRILEFITFYQNALHLTRVHCSPFYQNVLRHEQLK